VVVGGFAGGEIDGAPELRLALLQAPTFDEDDRQGASYRRVVRRQLDRFAELRLALLRAPLSVQDDRERRVVFGLFRLQLQRPADLRFGLCELPPLPQVDPQGAMVLGFLRGQLDRPPKDLLGLLRFALGFEDDAEASMAGAVGGLQLDRAPELSCGLVELALALVLLAPLQVGEGVTSLGLVCVTGSQRDESMRLFMAVNTEKSRQEEQFTITYRVGRFQIDFRRNPLLVQGPLTDFRGGKWLYPDPKAPVPQRGRKTLWSSTFSAICVCGAGINRS
jgi:hypothetical protein